MASASVMTATTASVMTAATAMPATAVPSASAAVTDTVVHDRESTATFTWPASSAYGEGKNSRAGDGGEVRRSTVLFSCRGEDETFPWASSCSARRCRRTGNPSVG